MADPFRAGMYLLTVRPTCRDVKARTVDVRKTSERVAKQVQVPAPRYEVGRGLNYEDVSALMAYDGESGWRRSTPVRPRQR